MRSQLREAKGTIRGRKVEAEKKREGKKKRERERKKEGREKVSMVVFTATRRDLVYVSSSFLRVSTGNAR